MIADRGEGARTPARRRMSLVADDSGATAVVTAIVLFFIVGIAALVIDVGALFAERRAMQTAADSAALAGVMELRPPDSSFNGSAIGVADEYVGLNDDEATTKDIKVGTTFVANDTVSVTIANPAARLYFARIWDKDSAVVPAAAVAVVESPSAYSHGVMPFGIMSKDATSLMSPFGYAFNELVTLKESSKAGEQGNFQFMSLTDPPGGHDGANEIRGAVEGGGVDNPVYLGAEYNTRTGINGGNVISSMESWIGGDGHGFYDVVSPPDEAGTVKFVEQPGEPDGCHRIIICPIIVNSAYPEGDPLRYAWTEVNGTKPALVVGFAYFYIESWGGRGGTECWITGRFIRPLSAEALDYGGVNEWGGLHFTLLH